MNAEALDVLCSDEVEHLDDCRVQEVVATAVGLKSFNHQKLHQKSPEAKDALGW